MELIGILEEMMSKTPTTAKMFITPETARVRRNILRVRLDGLCAALQSQYNDIPQTLVTPGSVLLYFKNRSDYARLIEIYAVLQQLQYVEAAVGDVIEYFDIAY